jgi:hypothetical protein
VVLANDVNWFPMAVFTGAATLVAFRHNALPRWLAWFGAAVALSSPIGALAIVVDTGPFSSAGIFSIVGLLLFLLWLLLLSVVLIQKAGRAHALRAPPIPEIGIRPVRYPAIRSGFITTSRASSETAQRDAERCKWL